MYQLPEISFFDRKDRSKRQKTKVLFVTLTYRRDGRIDSAWEDVGKDYNRWISGLRRRYGKIHVLRNWEAQSDGYPHIHCVLYFEEREFETFFYNEIWRLNAKVDLLGIGIGDFPTYLLYLISVLVWVML